jgi:hypothetical protein
MKPMLCALAFTFSLATFSQAESPVTDIEIWSGADDGLTQRLVDELRQTVAKDPRFRLALAYTSGAFKILIPTNVQWTKMSADVTVSADFSIDGKALGQTTVVCTQSTLGECARKIFLAAKRTLPMR